MSRIEARPFKPSDLDGFYDGTLERRLCEIDARLCHTDGPAMSYWDGEKLIACGGIRIYWKGVGEAWMAATPEIIHYRRELLSYARQFLSDSADEYGLWRLECNVRSDFPGAIRLARHLGFQIEGIRRKYGTDGIDCFLYSAVR
jgi:hypothetical protein